MGHVFTKVDYGYQYAVGIKDNGTVWQWEPSTSSEPIRIGHGDLFVDVCAGYRHFMAFKANGSLWSWGQNNFGQLGDGTVENRDVPIE